MANRVTGLQEVTKNLRKQIAEIEGATLKGLIRGAILIIRDAEKTSPVTPVDSGNLRASRFVVTSKGASPVGRSPSFDGPNKGKLESDHNSVTSKSQGEAKAAGGPSIVLGYTAFYATYVHERVGVNFQRPGAGAKWLEAAIKRNEVKVLDVIREEAKR
jgi:hypothetical protein